MGFWETLEKIAEVADNALKEAKETQDYESERCRHWSDSELIAAYKRTTRLFVKSAYLKELKNRGYSAEDLQ